MTRARGFLAGVVGSAAALCLASLCLGGCRKPAEPGPADIRTPPSLGPRFYPPDGWTTTRLGLTGFAPVRYGVAAPPGVPRATVVIVAASEETAEVYFETARDLIAKGYTVWILDPAPTPAAGAAALRSVVIGLVRPRTGDTVILAGGRSGALPVLLAAEGGPLPISGVVLWSPKLSEPLAAQAARQVSQGLGDAAASGEKDWVRPTYDITGRATLADAWRTANPDLRPVKRPWNWFMAQAQAAALATENARLKAVSAPVLIVQDRTDARAQAACAAMAHCQRRLVDSPDQPPHLAIDRVRNAWLDAVTGFVEAGIEAHRHDA